MERRRLNFQGQKSKENREVKILLPVNTERRRGILLLLSCFFVSPTHYAHVCRLKTGLLCRVGLVVSVSASHTVDHEFASRPGHTKDHHKNGTNCLPAWHAMR